MTQEASKSRFKIIDRDHPEINWTIETSPTSNERILFEYNFADTIKGWFSIVPKYMFRNKDVTYAALYYTREQAEERKVDVNFAVVELVWEQLS